MNILLIGSGGREHAFAWKLTQSPRCKKLFIAPGNSGTAAHGQNVNLDISDELEVTAFLLSKEISMVVIGPEQPLVDGLADFLRTKGVIVIGPGRAGARLEASKFFSKTFMDKYDIPTAAYASYDAQQLQQAYDFIDKQSLPIVVKASGLAAGKGVLICQSHAEAKEGARRMLSGDAFGLAGQTIVIEQYLEGIEISIFVLSDGINYKILPSAKDYKRIGEGDTGLNTGGMGAISPVPFADAYFMQKVEKEIVQPSLDGLRTEGVSFKGFLFMGLMVVDGKAYLLEYNVRMGDPETEVVLPRLKTDLVELFEAVGKQTLDQIELEFDERACATVMLVSGGYPEAYAKDKAISGLESISDSILFHAGMKQDSEALLTSGGRVLAITSYGKSISEAVANSLANAEKVKFEGKYFRRDIGQDL